MPIGTGIGENDVSVRNAPALRTAFLRSGSGISDLPGRAADGGARLDATLRPLEGGVK
ncbi:MAG: hypothetical protein ACRDGI_06370 [Candidatus Limnocylindrales bacterium]